MGRRAWVMGSWGMVTPHFTLYTLHFSLSASMSDRRIPRQLLPSKDGLQSGEAHQPADHRDAHPVLPDERLSVSHEIIRHIDLAAGDPGCGKRALGVGHLLKVDFIKLDAVYASRLPQDCRPI